MKLSGIKKLIVAAALLASVCITLSSCNRGIGCPSDFSLEQVATPVVKGVLNIR